MNLRNIFSKKESDAGSKNIIIIVVVLLVLGLVAFGANKIVIPSKNVKKNLTIEEASSTAEKFINENLLPAGTTATVKNVTDEGDVYNINLDVAGQDYTSYMSKDGSKFFQSGINMATFAADQAKQAAAPAANNSAAAAPTVVPKSDKPKVELYVFTYCPYGTQSEKGIIPAVKLLGNKIDFRIRQIGAMHGEHEKIEAQRQLCIEKNFPTKLLDYVDSFALDSAIGACGSDAQCSAPLVNALYVKFGITKSTIDACMKTDGATLYAAEEANAQSKNIGGSPTLVINGAQSSAGRDSASYLAGICAAFNTAPAECAQQLSSASPAAGFGAGASSDSAAASCN